MGGHGWKMFGIVWMELNWKGTSIFVPERQNIWFIWFWFKKDQILGSNPNMGQYGGQGLMRPIIMKG